MALNIFWCLLTKEKWNVADFVSFHRLTERIVLPAAAFIRYGSAHTSTSCCFFFHARRFAYCAYSFIISCFRTAFCCFKYWVTLDYMYSCENLWTFFVVIRNRSVDQIFTFPRLSSRPVHIYSCFYDDDYLHWQCVPAQKLVTGSYRLL